MQPNKRDDIIALCLAPVLVCVLVWCAYTWRGEILELLQKSVTPSSYYQVTRGDFHLIIIGIATAVAVYFLMISIHLFSCSDALPESLPVQFRKQWDRLVGIHFSITLILVLGSVIGGLAWVNWMENIVASQMPGIDWDILLAHISRFFMCCGGLGFYLGLFFCNNVSKSYKRRILPKASDGC